MHTLEAGTPAPLFELPDQNGNLVRLADFKGKKTVVVYFYPKAMTPGCTVQACGIPYRGGIHWVHNNCGDRPTKSDPDGWLKVIRSDGRPGPNLEANRKYCYLWPRR